MSITANRVRVVAGIIFRSDRVLACQRHESGAFPFKWEFPGGKIKSEESNFIALRRELQEELGILVSDAAPIF
jgi:8-oxo-dGTP diphosphatase